MPDSTTCPACGNAASGRFCSSCGATLDASACGECGAALAPGARYCHRCGATVGHAVASFATPAGVPSSGERTSLPWIIAGSALVALVVLVAARGARSPELAASPSPPAPMAGGRAPDISGMTPRERADRLFDRVMSYAGRGAMDSVRMFAPMALAAFDLAQPLDADGRYDLGRIAEVAGLADLARAQADTILASHRDHLLGLALASSVARMRGDARSGADYDRRLVSAESREMARGLPEYQRHRDDIRRAVELARRSSPR